MGSRADALPPCRTCRGLSPPAALPHGPPARLPPTLQNEWNGGPTAQIDSRNLVQLQFSMPVMLGVSPVLLPGPL